MLLSNLHNAVKLGCLTLAVVLLTTTPGCSHSKQDLLPRPGPTGPAQTVEQLHLLLTAVAIDLDGKPGPDGFGVRLYASNRRSNDAPAINQGKLEILMFDGSLTTTEIQSGQPLKTWSFDANDLKLRGHKTSIGMSYQFVLGWGQDRPTNTLITIVARYTPEKGSVVLSGPGTIPVSIK